MLTLITLLIGSILVVSLIGYLMSAPRYRGPVNDHFDGKKFINPGTARAKGLGDVLKWMITRRQGAWKERKDTQHGDKPADRLEEGVRITFVNHSTFLIQVDGFNILTDPLWSKRTSPVEWAGPKRMRPPGIRFEDLPAIDLVLLSHNHWDHLDINTIKRICDVHNPRIITPLGVRSFLEKEGVMQAADLDWWQEASIADSLKVQAVPAQHFSGRGMFDRDATLWCGYIIRRPGGNIYFVGDTGYNDQTFNEIGSRCAPIGIALIPIGAFKPSWFMSPIHCSPAEAVKIHQEVKATTSIATHFGTFQLADDSYEEPVLELRKALEDSGIQPTSFIVLEEGSARDF